MRQDSLTSGGAAMVARTSGLAAADLRGGALAWLRRPASLCRGRAHAASPAVVLRRWVRGVAGG